MKSDSPTPLSSQFKSTTRKRTLPSSPPEENELKGTSDSNLDYEDLEPFLKKNSGYRLHAQSSRFSSTSSVSASNEETENLYEPLTPSRLALSKNALSSSSSSTSLPSSVSNSPTPLSSSSSLKRLETLRTPNANALLGVQESNLTSPLSSLIAKKGFSSQLKLNVSELIPSVIHSAPTTPTRASPSYKLSFPPSNSTKPFPTSPSVQRSPCASSNKDREERRSKYIFECINEYSVPIMCIPPQAAFKVKCSKLCCGYLPVLLNVTFYLNKLCTTDPQLLCLGTCPSVQIPKLYAFSELTKLQCTNDTEESYVSFALPNRLYFQCYIEDLSHLTQFHSILARELISLQEQLTLELELAEKEYQVKIAAIYAKYEKRKLSSSTRTTTVFGECTLCFEGKLSKQLHPCGHQLCDGCVDKLTTSLCPWDRQCIQKITSIEIV